MDLHADFISPFGLRKLALAREKEAWGEYVGRLLVLVRLLDARPHRCFGSVVFQWPKGYVHGVRTELVLASMEWCNTTLIKEEQFILAARVLLSVALPQVRRIAVKRNDAYPTEHGVRRLLAEVLSYLQVKAFHNWEKAPTGDTGPRMLEWAIQNLKFLHKDTSHLEALQFLYFDPGDTLVRQAMLSSAFKLLTSQKDDVRAARAQSLLLPLVDHSKSVKHGDHPITPLSACARLESLRVPYIPIESREYLKSFEQKK